MYFFFSLFLLNLVSNKIRGYLAASQSVNRSAWMQWTELKQPKNENLEYTSILSHQYDFKYNFNPKCQLQ